ncbi:MAG: hypothetical protein JO102_00475, partial [Elusimicrobia bacterium]|nr:hypothetical protein [Elusimicrobiota bacterium]
MKLLVVAAIAALHTVLGPDHYLPLAALSQASRWPIRRTLALTAIFGAAHVLSAAALGFAALAGGSVAARWLGDAARSTAAGNALMAVGVVYAAWALVRRFRRADEAPPAGWPQRLLFVAFLVGPCEPLIPVLIAAAESGRSPALVATVFGAVTVATMTILVGALTAGLAVLPT